MESIHHFDATYPVKHPPFGKNGNHHLVMGRNCHNGFLVPSHWCFWFTALELYISAKCREKPLDTEYPSNPIKTPSENTRVSKNRGENPPKSSILIGFSIINHPFWGFSHYFWKHPYGIVVQKPSIYGFYSDFETDPKNCSTKAGQDESLGCPPQLP